MAPTSPGTTAVLNPFLEDHLDRLAGNGLILDYGSGRGFWLAQFRARGYRAVGVEPDPDRARGCLPSPVAGGDGMALPFRDGAVAVVWCIHVLHHLADPARALAEVRRVLRPGGQLVLAETVQDNPVINLGRRVRPEWDGVAVESRFTAVELTDLVVAAGFDVSDRRQHSLVSFAAWALPRWQARAWRLLTRVEDALPRRLDRYGAHLELVARAVVHRP